METKNLDIYGSAPIPWSRAEHALDTVDPMQTFWLSTTDPDGNPHMAGVGAIWEGGKIYFVSGPSLRKSRNLAANPHCAIGVGLQGLDLVVEGTAAKVTDPATMDRAVKRFVKGGWPVEVREGALFAPYSAPSAGSPPWDLYEVTMIRATAVAGAEPHGATRWQFAKA